MTFCESNPNLLINCNTGYLNRYQTEQIMYDLVKFDIPFMLFFFLSPASVDKERMAISVRETSKVIFCIPSKSDSSGRVNAFIFDS